MSKVEIDAPGKTMPIDKARAIRDGYVDVIKGICDQMHGDAQSSSVLMGLVALMRKDGEQVKNPHQREQQGGLTTWEVRWGYQFKPGEPFGTSRKISIAPDPLNRYMLVLGTEAQVLTEKEWRERKVLEGAVKIAYSNPEVYRLEPNPNYSNGR